MKTIAIIAISALSLAAGTTAIAEDLKPQYYVSGGVQSTSTDKSDAELKGFNAKLGARFNPYWGVEGEAAVGSGKDNGIKLSNSAAVYGVGYYPLNEKLDLLGRVGVADTALKNAGKNESGTSLNYGVGAQYHFNPDYAVRLDLTRAEFRKDYGSSDTAAISVVKKF
jgi:hypothetical protein